MEKKPSWDDIPSLNLETDDDTGENSSIERRSGGRLSCKDIKNMLLDKIKDIQVQVANRDGTIPKKGLLENINEKGMRFSMPGHGLKQNDQIMVGFVIGKRTCKSRAVVRWQTENSAGIEFIELNEDDANFFKDLYSAKAFSHRI